MESGCSRTRTGPVEVPVGLVEVGDDEPEDPVAAATEMYTQTDPAVPPSRIPSDIAMPVALTVEQMIKYLQPSVPLAKRHIALTIADSLTPSAEVGYVVEPVFLNPDGTVPDMSDRIMRNLPALMGSDVLFRRIRLKWKGGKDVSIMLTAMDSTTVHYVEMDGTAIITDEKTRMPDIRSTKLVYMCDLVKATKPWAKMEGDIEHIHFFVVLQKGEAVAQVTLRIQEPPYIPPIPPVVARVVVMLQKDRGTGMRWHVENLGDYGLISANGALNVCSEVTMPAPPVPGTNEAPYTFKDAPDDYTQDFEPYAFATDLNLSEMFTPEAVGYYKQITERRRGEAADVVQPSTSHGFGCAAAHSQLPPGGAPWWYTHSPARFPGTLG